MGKMKQVSMDLDYLNAAAGLNDTVVRHEYYDGEAKFVLYLKDSTRVLAAYESADSMYGFLDGLDYMRTGRGPAE